MDQILDNITESVLNFLNVIMAPRLRRKMSLSSGVGAMRRRTQGQRAAMPTTCFHVVQKKKGKKIM